MHYEFEAGLILQPEQYQTQDLIPDAGLSPVDIETIRLLYPPLEPRLPVLRPFESQRFTIAAGQQIDFAIHPTWSRTYRLQTFGRMDTVMVLYEDGSGAPRYMAGDDDSGRDYNAKIVARLERDRKYIVRTRLYWAHTQGSGAIMIY